jgi:hypothetical protein
MEDDDLAQVASSNSLSQAYNGLSSHRSEKLVSSSSSRKAGQVEEAAVAGEEVGDKKTDSTLSPSHTFDFY